MHTVKYKKIYESQSENKPVLVHKLRLAVSSPGVILSYSFPGQFSGGFQGPHSQRDGHEGTTNT